MSENPRGDALYLIGEGNGCPVVKIGRAKDPEARIAFIQTGNPRKLHVLHVWPGQGHMEGRVHGAFSGRRLAGEWFDFGPRDPVDAVTCVLTGGTPRPQRRSRSACPAPEPVPARKPQSVADLRPARTRSEQRLIDFYSDAVADLLAEDKARGRRRRPATAKRS